jgi:phosphate transport system substrate-binding protein
MSLQRTLVAGVAGLILVAGLAACATPEPTAEPAAPAEQPSTEAMGPTTAPSLAGDLAIDGSSTVYPITEAIAEDFMTANPDARVTVAFSGTGGGFKKFCNKET